MTELITACRNLANVPKKIYLIFCHFVYQVFTVQLYAYFAA